MSPTPAHELAAFARLRKAHWPASLDEALADPIFRGVIHGLAVNIARAELMPAPQASPTPSSRAPISDRLRTDAATGVIEKRCTRCWEWWPLDPEFFHRESRTPGAYVAWCRACRTVRPRGHTSTRESTFDPKRAAANDRD